MRSRSKRSWAHQFGLNYIKIPIQTLSPPVVHAWQLSLEFMVSSTLHHDYSHRYGYTDMSMTMWEITRSLLNYLVPMLQDKQAKEEEKTEEETLLRHHRRLDRAPARHRL
jgi:hypothetical protein